MSTRSATRPRPRRAEPSPQAAAGSASAGLRRGVRRDGGLFIALDGLGPGAVSELATLLAGGVPGARLAGWLELAGGNPLYLREMLDALGELADHLVVDGERSEPVSEHRVVEPLLAPDAPCRAERALPDLGALAADHAAFAGDRAHHDPPAGPELADAVLSGHDDVGEEDLVELGVAGHLAKRADVDAGRRHVDDEHTEPPVA